MTQHELLAFVEGLHEAMKGWYGNPNVVWPTRALLVDNFRFNRELWGGARAWAPQFRAALGEARRRQWLETGIGLGCSRQCHAEHVRVTAMGAQALATMDRDGCQKHRRRTGECASGFGYRDTQKRAA